MADNDPSTPISDDQVAFMKDQLAPVMRRMTRLQIFEMADFFYAQARERNSDSGIDDWRFEISV